MRVCWTVDDGYMGSHADHYTEVPGDELEECETEEQREDVIADYVQTDFDKRIKWKITKRETE